jgi:hypothetical protein
MMPIEDIIPRCRPYLGDDPDYSQVIYPNPPSHDFLTFLMIATLMMREKLGRQARLRVSLLLDKGMLGKYDFGTLGILDGRAGVPGLPLSYFNQMYSGVLKPAMDMIGAIEEPALHVPVNSRKIERY